MLLSVTTTPVVIRAVIRKNLLDIPDGERKIHENRKPTMGGISIFFATILTSSFFIAAGNFDYSWISIVGLILMFFTGLKDDLIHIPAAKKLLVQVFAALVVIQISQIEINNFLGLFGIGFVPSWIALPITLLTFIFIINAYNLIDGVDGLATGVGIIASAFFGIWNYTNGNMGFAILAFSLFGSLIGFLYYNFSPAKIFMGDTGSLVVGFILATLAVSAIHNTGEIGNAFSNSHLANVINYSIAALIIPIYDTLRVFTFRILKRKSPFQPGKDHIHHAMLRVGFTHKTLSLTIYLINIALIGFVGYLSFMSIDPTIVFILLVSLSVLILPTFSLKRRFVRLIGFDVFPQVNPDIIDLSKNYTNEIITIEHSKDDLERRSLEIHDIFKN
jgi:UDP-GlcNAc:undecaprenyl-phosphate/decaprenyl-phosphate GlcNAc-1-phosphate transferase